MQRRLLAASAAALTALFVTPNPARACGGLFCSSGPQPLPIDQSAEQIIFQVAEGAITVHVQIRYAGEPTGFAWVIPMASVPQVADSTADLFTALDTATRPLFTLPPPEPCSGGGGMGCDSPGAPTMAVSAKGGGAMNTSDPGGVRVESHGYTETYEYTVVSGTDTAELVDWLKKNAYNVSDNMTPVMDVYNAPHMRFAAFKLLAEKEATDIVPIALTYEGSIPMIPIQLTAVAAQPLMGIQVYILAEYPYVPSNYLAIDPDPTEIYVDSNNLTTYYPWAARRAAELDGKAFVMEFVGDNPVLGTVYGDWMLQEAIVSRYYTRISPQHMTLDPMFSPASPTVRASNLVDLSGQPAVTECGSPIPDRQPPPCAYHFCGVGASCVVFDTGEVGCICPGGQVAQPFKDPMGADSVTCMPKESPYGVTPAAGGQGTEYDPCKSFACGTGTCVLRGGFPSCACDERSAAMLVPGGTMTCKAFSGVAYGPGADPRSAPKADAPTPPSSSASGRLFLALPLLMLLGIQWRRWRLARSTT